MLDPKDIHLKIEILRIGIFGQIVEQCSVFIWPEFKTMRMVTKGYAILFKKFSSIVKNLNRFFRIGNIKVIVFMGDPKAYDIFRIEPFCFIYCRLWIGF
jgi:hypothetical protein